MSEDIPALPYHERIGDMRAAIDTARIKFKAVIDQGAGIKEQRDNVQDIFVNVLGHSRYPRRDQIEGSPEQEQGEIDLFTIPLAFDTGPEILVQVFRMDVDLSSEHVHLHNPVAVAGLRWVILTNGRAWQLYRITSGVPRLGRHLRLVSSWDLLEHGTLRLAPCFDSICWNSAISRRFGVGEERPDREVSRSRTRDAYWAPSFPLFVALIIAGISGFTRNNIERDLGSCFWIPVTYLILVASVICMAVVMLVALGICVTYYHRAFRRYEARQLLRRRKAIRRLRIRKHLIAACLLVTVVLCPFTALYAIAAILSVTDTLSDAPIEVDSIVRERLNEQLGGIVWPSEKTRTTALHASVRNLWVGEEDPGGGKALFLDARSEVSDRHFAIQKQRRAESVSDAEIVISIDKSTEPHASAEWVTVDRTGRKIPAGKVQIPVWTVEILDRRSGQLYSREFRGHISGGKTATQNLLSSGTPLDVTVSPINEVENWLGYSVLRAPRRDVPDAEERFVRMLKGLFGGRAGED